MYVEWCLAMVKCSCMIAITSLVQDISCEREMSRAYSIRAKTGSEHKIEGSSVSHKRLEVFP